MKPVEFEGSNALFKLPGGTSENDCPIERSIYPIEGEPGKGIPALESVWELDTDDMAAVSKSKQLRLIIYAAELPPVTLRVEGSDPSHETPIARSHLRRAIFELVSRLNEMGINPASVEDVLAGLDECLLATAEGNDEQKTVGP